MAKGQIWLICLLVLDRFSCQMACFETKIRHEIPISRQFPGHVVSVNVTFWRSCICEVDRFDVTIQCMHIKKLRIFGLFLTQMGPNGNKWWFSQDRIATSAPLQIRIWDNAYICKNWNCDIQRNFQLKIYLQRYSSFSPIWLVKWKRDSTFEDLRALWPPLTEQDNASKKKLKLESRNGITCVEFVSQTCFNDVERKSCNSFVQHAWIILWILPFYPSKRPFQQITLATIGTVFGRPPSCAHVNSNQGSQMWISKSWIMNMQRTLRSRKNIGMQNFSENGNLLVKYLNLSAIFGFRTASLRILKKVTPKFQIQWSIIHQYLFMRSGTQHPNFELIDSATQISFLHWRVRQPNESDFQNFDKRICKYDSNVCLSFKAWFRDPESLRL